MGEMEMTDSDLTELLTEMRWCVDQGFMGPRSANAMRKAVMALESRASNAGGAVAYIPDDALARLTPPLLVLDGVRLYRYNGVGTTALYLHPAPAPASKEPVADERAAEFDNLIDVYQSAQKDGSLDDRANARAALKSAYRAALATAQTPGWRLVPVAPTPAMTHAGRYGGDPDAPAIGERAIEGETAWPLCAGHTADVIYRAMLAAAPAKPEGV